MIHQSIELFVDIFRKKKNYPGTMMIHFQYTLAAHRAMMRTIRFNHSAFVTVSQRSVHCSEIERKNCLISVFGLAVPFVAICVILPITDR